jgi:phosphatidylserine/phosphatidylglycerophosphate/cardiolipin synthase-like enzyme
MKSSEPNPYGDRLLLLAEVASELRLTVKAVRYLIYAIAHNKVIVIDSETVLTGSFNFTKAAQEKNAENLLIIRDPALAAQYTQNWDTHRQHSQPYVGRVVR